MAPESERANYPNGTEQRKNGDCYQCGFPRHQHLEGKKCPPRETEYQSKREPALTCSDCGHPKDDSRYHLDAPGTNWGAALHAFVPPTSLTCSEVVERLRDECINGAFNAYLAEKILHSWRERDERKNLAMLLDRMGGDSVVAYQEGRTADEFRDYIYEHFVWWGERNREEERFNNDKK